jgi:quercetin dioxygenase-like cupin family protein
MLEQVSIGDLSLHPDVQGAVWSHKGNQLAVNVLYFDKGEGVPLHVNEHLDVWIVVLQGRGQAIVNGESHTLVAGSCLYIEAGSERAIHSTGEPLVYASAHQARGGLMPR